VLAATRLRDGSRGMNPLETAAPPGLEPYCMAATTMSLELHGCGIHAV
jgi:hypothetical protein